MMKGSFARIVLLLLIGLAATSGFALAQGTPAPLGIIPTPTPQPLTVRVWSDKSAYVIGENATVYFNVSQAAYIYIYDVQPDGVVRLIFPNAYSQQNYVSAGTHTLPNGSYQFTIVPPAGTEHLQIIASPINLGLTPPAYYEPFPLVGSTPQAATAEIQVQIKGIMPVPTYASDWTSFTIASAYTYTPPSYYNPYTPYTPPSSSTYPPFYGYPGATWYWNGSTWVSGRPASGLYWYFGTDGSWHFRISFHFGISN